MKTTKYLYDIDVSAIAELQIELATIKIEAGKKLVDKLQEIHWSERDDERIYEVISAIKLNNEMIVEIRDSE